MLISNIHILSLIELEELLIFLNSSPDTAKEILAHQTTPNKKYKEMKAEKKKNECVLNNANLVIAVGGYYRK